MIDNNNFENLVNITETIIIGASRQHLVSIRYRDQQGNVTVRVIEPYEFKEGKLYAYCRGREAIRAFSVTSIISATVLKEEFIARFPILIKDFFIGS